MAAYLERFEDLLNDVGGQSSEMSLISFFIGGLEPELRFELNIIQPTSLRKAFSLAKLFEVQRGHGKRGGSSGTSEPLPASAKGLPIVRKMLTIEERKERSAKGLCFNCDESYSPGHKCKGRLFQMDADQTGLVELVDQPEESEVEEIVDPSVTTIEISLQALSGSFNPLTIMVKGWVLGRPLIILIDSGSTHNFVQESVVARLGYEVEALPAFKMFIGSGEHLVCKDVCRLVENSLQNTVVTKDLFVLPMGGANIVLGIQWLDKLGAATTNYRDLSMEFTVGRRPMRSSTRRFTTAGGRNFQYKFAAAGCKRRCGLFLPSTRRIPRESNH